MWELDCEESWVPKNLCFWTVVLDKTFESPLDCKEMQPVHSKGDQPWVFFGRTDAKAETQYFGHLMQRVDSLEKTLRLRGIVGRREGDDRGWVAWMASAARWMWVWVKSKSKGLVIRNLPANEGDLGLILGLGRFPGEGNDNHSSNLARKIPWREDPGSYSPWGCKRLRHDLATKKQHKIVWS